ncbi:MAG: sulfatase-like hydrolase/transferase [Mariniblastus sp.]|nr:sulfatase-like hydrolase/transferase [Mariniblastus sp.]
MSIVSSACLFLLISGSVLAEDPRPNFVFILTDDQSQETLRCYGNTVCDTPHLDRLAAEGMVIQDAHHMGAWVGAVCRPSRTMIMTGRHVWNIPGNRAPEVESPPNFLKTAAQQSMPAVFNRAGYDTFRTCKTGNSYAEANALFDVVRDATKRGGTEDKGSAWHGDQVLDYLDQRRADQDKDPFLIYFGLSHPHDPRRALPVLAEKYGATNEDAPLDKPNPKAPPLPINWLPEHPFHHGHPNLRDEVKVPGVMERRDEATVRNELAREYACIENIDRQIGRVLEKLEAMGELENTYILFTSDHGIAVGRHGLMGKQNLYEHTWKVPFIVRGPGVQPGSKASGFIYLSDVLPTLCDLAGIEIPDVVDGKSFRPVLEGDEERVRDCVYGVYCGGTKPGMRSIKTPDGWKLIEYNVLGKEVRETQLFHLSNNPHEFLDEHNSPELSPRVEAGQGQPLGSEQRNLAYHPEYQLKRQAMAKRLALEMQRLKDPYDLDGTYSKEMPKRRNPRQKSGKSGGNSPGNGD